MGECYCSQLFKLEQALTELTPEERYEKRLEQEKPVLDALLSWANEMQAKTAPKSALGKAIHYLLEQWPYLTRYLARMRCCFTASARRMADSFSPSAAVPNTKMYVESLALEDLNEIDRVRFQLLSFKRDKEFAVR